MTCCLLFTGLLGALLWGKRALLKGPRGGSDPLDWRPHAVGGPPQS